MSAPLRVVLPDESATVALGKALARALPAASPAMLLALQGDLGAGKSTLARALLRELGVSGPIRSPTYTLVEPYRVERGDCLHLDLYRLADPAELDFLGLEDLHPHSLLWIVEWPERGGDRLPAADLQLTLEQSEAGRVARLQALSPRAMGWLRGAGLGEV